MALGAVHHRLIDEGIRCDANIILETGSARNPHHFAVLVGYGATAIYPYLAYEVISELSNRKNTSISDFGLSVSNYIKGINKGLLKIMSKMGISCIASYRGAQLFELVGLDQNVVDLCFRDTVSRISGTDFTDIQLDLIENRKSAWNLAEQIRAGGLLKYIHGEEYHDYNPDVVKLLQACVSSGDYKDYEKFSSLINQREPSFLRDLLKVNKEQKKNSIDVKKVEPIENIVKRFDTAGMSLGALSPEAHEALAIAMNTICLLYTSPSPRD